MAMVVGMGMGVWYGMKWGCDAMYAFPRISRRQRGLSFVPGHGAFPAGHCTGGFFWVEEQQRRRLRVRGCRCRVE